MSNNKTNDSEDDRQPIPEERREIPSDEMTKSHDSHQQTPENSENMTKIPGHYDILPPGRIPNSDSIEASSDDLGGDRHGYSFSSGYDCSMATRIGDEEASNSDIDRLRELHEGRHRSDGKHSVRESERDKERIAQAICTSLPLASPEREMVINTVKNIDFDRFGYQKGIPRVTLGVVAVLVDELHRTADGNSEEIVQWSDEFRSTCDGIDVSMSDLSTIKRKVREVIQEGDLEIWHKERVPNRDPILPAPTSPEDLPYTYWENRSAADWEYIAKTWERRTEEMKEAIPDEYRKHVDLLRRWKPWEETKENQEEDTQSSDSGSSSSILSVDDAGKEAIEMAEEMMSEMEKEENPE